MSFIFLGNNLIELDLIDSTNDYCKNLLKEGKVEEGTVILADFQKKGKGLKGNFWESEKGKNLTFSIILYPEFLNARLQFYITMSISLGIVEFLDHMSINSKIKWPNDIYVKNKKIAGILIENSLIKDRMISSVAGIGINVNQKDFISNAPNPTSICLESDKIFDLRNTYKSLIFYLNKWTNLLYNLNYIKIKTNYQRHLFLVNKNASFTDKNGKFQGTILGVEETGMLLIKTDSDKPRKYNFKEVIFPC